MTDLQRVARQLAKDDLANREITKDQFDRQVKAYEKWLQESRDSHVRSMHSANDY